ncbi:hypothetical protein Pcinc_038243 [Petrolisthes cinctipes]|uniref:Uncharacterized protein n=1 Tax=Petrolisthes cinctipes TaxID=88211 RepID=A0AAE1EK95_PETCI|nr:hypothetical protein Pcinc_038243 [Petrolisthes cinctipes]
MLHIRFHTCTYSFLHPFSCTSPSAIYSPTTLIYSCVLRPFTPPHSLTSNSGRSTHSLPPPHPTSMLRTSPLSLPALVGHSRVTTSGGNNYSKQRTHRGGETLDGKSPADPTNASSHQTSTYKKRQESLTTGNKDNTVETRSLF